MPLHSNPPSPPTNPDAACCQLHVCLREGNSEFVCVMQRLIFYLKSTFDFILSGDAIVVCFMEVDLRDSANCNLKCRISRYIVFFY